MSETWLQRVTKSWAVRSLLIGASATAIDLALGVTIIHFNPDQSRLAAMSGTIVGSTFTYFMNRRFAFKQTGDVKKSAWRFVLTTLLLSAIHGQAMVVLRDKFHVPYALAKVIADIVVFTFTQLVLFRFFVFAPEKKKPEDTPPEAAGTSAAPTTAEVPSPAGERVREREIPPE